MKHFSRNSALFPQVTLILSAIPPSRAARCAPEGWDLSSHSLNRSYQALVSGWSPSLLSYARASFPVSISGHCRAICHSLAILISPCSQALHGLSKPEPLDFGLVFFLLALDALESGGNSHSSEISLAETSSTS